jgi:cytochrome c biogenesis factor
MSKSAQEDWVSSTVAVAICLLTALVSPTISLPVALVAMVGMAFYYRRRQQSRIGMILAACGAAVIAVAIAFLIIRGRFH